MKIVGEKLKELRLEKGLSQNDLAELLKITRVAYGRYENNIRDVSLETLCKLADFYKVTTDYLLGRED